MILYLITGATVLCLITPCSLSPSFALAPKSSFKTQNTIFAASSYDEISDVVSSKARVLTTGDIMDMERRSQFFIFGKDVLRSRAFAIANGERILSILDHKDGSRIYVIRWVSFVGAFRSPLLIMELKEKEQILSAEIGDCTGFAAQWRWQNKSYVALGHLNDKPDLAQFISWLPQDIIDLKFFFRTKYRDQESTGKYKSLGAEERQEVRTVLSSIQKKFPGVLFASETASNAKDTRVNILWGGREAIGLVHEGDKTPIFKSWNDFKPITEAVIGEATQSLQESFLDSFASLHREKPVTGIIFVNDIKDAPEKGLIRALVAKGRSLGISPIFDYNEFSRPPAVFKNFKGTSHWVIVGGELEFCMAGRTADAIFRATRSMEDTQVLITLPLLAMFAPNRSRRLVKNNLPGEFAKYLQDLFKNGKFSLENAIKLNPDFEFIFVSWARIIKEDYFNKGLRLIVLADGKKLCDINPNGKKRVVLNFATNDFCPIDLSAVMASGEIASKDHVKRFHANALKPVFNSMKVRGLFEGVLLNAIQEADGDPRALRRLVFELAALMLVESNGDLLLPKLFVRKDFEELGVSAPRIYLLFSMHHYEAYKKAMAVLGLAVVLASHFDDRVRSFFSDPLPGPGPQLANDLQRTSNRVAGFFRDESQALPFLDVLEGEKEDKDEPWFVDAQIAVLDALEAMDYKSKKVLAAVLKRLRALSTDIVVSTMVKRRIEEVIKSLKSGERNSQFQQIYSEAIHDFMRMMETARAKEMTLVKRIGKEGKNGGYRGYLKTQPDPIDEYLGRFENSTDFIRHSGKGWPKVSDDVAAFNKRSAEVRVDYDGILRFVVPTRPFFTSASNEAHYIPRFKAATRILEDLEKIITIPDGLGEFESMRLGHFQYTTMSYRYPIGDKAKDLLLNTANIMTSASGDEPAMYRKGQGFTIVGIQYAMNILLNKFHPELQNLKAGEDIAYEIAYQGGFAIDKKTMRDLAKAERYVGIVLSRSEGNQQMLARLRRENANVKNLVQLWVTNATKAENYPAYQEQGRLFLAQVRSENASGEAFAASL